MPTFIDGQYNIGGLTVPGVYVGIVPPQPTLIGSPTNFEGVVGVGSWGPVNAAAYFSTPDDCAVLYGRPQIRKHDIATHVAAASSLGGAIGYVGVRVTDGTDVASSVAIETNITLTGRYTGSLGNQITVTISAGSKKDTHAVTISFPGRQPEVFNNIGGTGNDFWKNVAVAINSGTPERAASRYVIATAGAGTDAPTLGQIYTLAGGTDGASGVTDAMLLGQDITPRTGMYALRNTGVDAFTLVDCTTTATWQAQDAFALGENALAVHAMAPGSTIADAIAARNSVGLDSWSSWLIVGDAPTFYDTVNSMSRMVSPAAFALGLLGNLSPEQSPLNKPLAGVISTQQSQTGATYSNAELGVAEMGGVDLIVGPPTTPGGNYYTFIAGRNTSSNGAANGVEYSRLTKFLSRSLQSKAAGSIVGRLQSIRRDDKTRSDAKAMVDGYLASLKDASLGSNGNGLIDDFKTTCDLSNNPPALQARGYLFLYAAVRYLNTVRYFVIRLAGGGNVQVTSQATPPTPAQFA